MKEKKFLIARKLPKSYQLTQHQLDMKMVLEQCQVRKGMSREQLVDKMRHCIPEAWKRLKEEKEKEKGAENQPP